MKKAMKEKRERMSSGLIMVGKMGKYTGTSDPTSQPMMSAIKVCHMDFQTGGLSAILARFSLRKYTQRPNATAIWNAGPEVEDCTTAQAEIIA